MRRGNISLSLYPNLLSYPKKITFFFFFGKEGKGEGGDIEEGKNKKDKKR